MKAKEYAQLYIKTPTPEIVGKVAIEMLVEVRDIAKLRHAHSDEALLSILNEQIDKWRAFTREVEKLAGCDHGIRDDGLKLFILKKFPFIPVDKLK